MVAYRLTLLPFLFLLWRQLSGFPESAPSWVELIATDGVKFSARNAHASCVFKGRIWVTGGRTALYTMYNHLDSYKVADVWSSANGAIWRRESFLTGDFFAQNTDVTQPGPIAPWFQRYGHSLDAVDLDGDGVEDLMIQLGGYASQPSNDMWVTADGNKWVYAGLAPWSPRAWHFTSTFQGKLWLMGGTPLNNEVWQLVDIQKINRTEPLTRSQFVPYTYNLTWKQMPHAPWSPRVGASLVSQWYFNTSQGETIDNSRERLVLIGGYGGFVESDSRYDGYYSRADTWSFDGADWTVLKAVNTFGGRAWMGAVVRHLTNPRDDVFGRANPPRIFIFGGGNTGFSVAEKRRITKMEAKADAWWSYDAVEWTKISYEEGGGTNTVPYYSSQEWSQTIVNTRTAFLGLWGLTVQSFNESTGRSYPGDLVLIAGDYDGGGSFSSSTYRSLPGLYCDVNGVTCNGRGTCSVSGCECDPDYAGFLCEEDNTNVVSSASRCFNSESWMLTSVIVLLSAALLI